MKIPDCIEALRRNMKTLKVVLIIFLVLLAAGDAILRLHTHGHYLIDSIPAYWTLFGALGCFLLVKVGKGAAHLFLSKDEDYYG